MAYSSIVKPSDYFNTITTTGGAKSVTGVGFQPDWVWNKRRDSTSDHHINDAVRGSSKLLYTNQTTAEQTNANFLTSFDSDGFTTGSGYWSSSANIVAWNWLANGAGSANTDGSISSTVSANTTSGFSIVKYTGNATSGATVGHGLGVTPKVIIIKGLGTTYNWIFGHNSLSTNWTNYLTLSTTDASAAATNIFNDTAPTSSVFSIGNALGVNTNSSDYIAYCLAEKQGYSKFGSYVGNGNNDGTFVYTGFKPGMIIIKPSSAIENWQILDNKRPGFNASDNLAPNNNAAENTSNDFVDLVSNGFKLRSSTYSASGTTYIYMAFAEEPLVANVGTGVPATAR